MSEENKIELRIDVSISQPPGNYQGLRLTETIVLPTRGFLEMCEILGEFQQLADRFRVPGR
jgi:hypothetical protein